MAFIGFILFLIIVIVASLFWGALAMLAAMALGGDLPFWPNAVVLGFVVSVVMGALIARR